MIHPSIPNCLLFVETLVFSPGQLEKK